MSESAEHPQTKPDLSTRVEELLGAIDAACADLESRLNEEGEASLDEIEALASGMLTSDDGVFEASRLEDVSPAIQALQEEVDGDLGALMESLILATEACEPQEEAAEAPVAEVEIPVAEAEAEIAAEHRDETEIVADEPEQSDLLADSEAENLTETAGVADEAIPEAGVDGLGIDATQLDAELATLADSMMAASETDADDSAAWEAEALAGLDAELVEEAVAEVVAEPEGEVVSETPAAASAPVAAAESAAEPEAEEDEPLVPTVVVEPVASAARPEDTSPMRPVPVAERTASKAEPKRHVVVRAVRRAWAVGKPAAIKVLAVGAPVVASGVLAAAKPAEKLPETIRQTIGWFAIYTAFLGICVWTFVLVFRQPQMPEPTQEAIGLQADGASSS